MQPQQRTAAGSNGLYDVPTFVATQARSVNHVYTKVGTGLILLTAVSFGVNTTLSRLAYDAGSNPLTAVFVRILGFVVFFGPFMMLTRRPFHLSWRGLVATGWMSVVLLVMSIGYLGSVEFIPVGLAAIIFYMFPFYVAVMSSLLGLALALGPSFDVLDWRGIAGALAAAAAFGTAIIFSGPIMRAHDVVTINWLTNLWMLLLLGAYLAVAGGFELPTTEPGAAGLAGGTLFYLIGFTAWLSGLAHVAPIRAAILLNLEPLVSIAAAWLLLGERMNVIQGVGVALVIAAVMAVAAMGARGKAPASP